jgi:hypothetical protein
MAPGETSRFEEGNGAAWLYGLLKPYVTKVVVCNPRRNALLTTCNKSDRIDARKLAEPLRAGLLSAVYHGETGKIPAIGHTPHRKDPLQTGKAKGEG